LTHAIAERKYEQLATCSVMIDALSRLAQCPEATEDNVRAIALPDPNGFLEDMTVGEYRAWRDRRSK